MRGDERRLVMYDEKRIAVAFLLGGLIGAGVALLYAPQSGSETRRDITRTARKIRKRSGELVENAIDSVNDFIDDIKDVTSDVVDRSVDLSESAKKEIVRAFEQGEKMISKQKDKLVDALNFKG
jgi:gas vesicle protein